VPEIPRTLTGKKSEVPVKRIMQGAAVDQVVSLASLQNPAAVDPYVAMAAQRNADRSA
jgi:acetoacetyl-CoA synthetase